MTMDIPIALKDLLGAAALTDVGVLPVGKVTLDQKWIAFDASKMALGWVIGAVIMAIPIIGLPWARAAFNIGAYTLLPFGQKAVSRAEYNGTEDVSTGPLGFLGNIDGWCSPAGDCAGASHHRDSPRGHHHRHPVRLGAFKARRDGALAYRQNDRARRRRVAPVPTPTLR